MIPGTYKRRAAANIALAYPDASPTMLREVLQQGLRMIMERRYRTLKAALDRPTRHWTIFPFNAGCFCLLKLREGLNAGDVRQKLIKDESVGVVSQGDRYIRIAFCSLDEASIAPLVEALERVCEGM